LLLAKIPVMSLEYPSINPWITIPQRMSPGEELVSKDQLKVSQIANHVARHDAKGN
jgi:hypothetical protein